MIYDRKESVNWNNIICLFISCHTCISSICKNGHNVYDHFTIISRYNVHEQSMIISRYNVYDHFTIPYSTCITYSLINARIMKQLQVYQFEISNITHVPHIKHVRLFPGLVKQLNTRSVAIWTHWLTLFS